MIPVDFKEANFTFTKPQGWTDEQCGSLQVYRESAGGYQIIISKWQPNKEDIEKINNGGAIYLAIHSHEMPPVSLQTESPFERGDEGGVGRQGDKEAIGKVK